MFGTILIALFTATILWLFDLDWTLTVALNEVFDTNFSTNIYWLFFFVMGVVLGIVHEITK